MSKNDAMMYYKTYSLTAIRLEPKSLVPNFSGCFRNAEKGILIW